MALPPLPDDRQALVDQLRLTGKNLDDLAEVIRSTPDVNPQWAKIAKFQLQQGVMSMIRAVAGPGW